MNKLKKSLSVFLTLVMLFTTLCFFVLPDMGISANAAEDDVIISVPETIYMTPNGGAATSGQYYVNNVLAADGTVTLDAVSNAQSGKVSIVAPRTVASATVNVVAASGSSIGEPVVEKENTTLTLTNGYYSADGFKLTSIANGLGIGQTALIRWEFTLTYKDGTTAKYYAYTTLYTPHRSVGAVAEARRSSDDNHEISSWITGINGIGGSGNWSPISSGSGSKTTQGIFKNDPLWTGLPGGGSSNSSDDFVTGSSSEYYVEAKGTDGSGSTRAIGYLGYITVDSSRYTNINQIPNFQIGSDALRVNGNRKDSLRQFSSWYVVGDSSKTIGTSKDSTPSGWTQFVNKSEPQGTSRNPLLPSYDIKSINGLYIHVASQGSCKYWGSTTWDYSNACVSAQFTTVNKTNLRAAVKTALTKQAAYGVKDGFGSVIYDTTSSTWTDYISAYENACRVLGTPGADANAISGAQSTLESAMAKLNANGARKIYFNVNYDGINPNLYVLGSGTVTSGGVTATIDRVNETITFNGTTTGNGYFSYTPFTPDVGTYTFSTTQVSGSRSGGGCLVLESYTDGKSQLNSQTGYERIKLDFTGSASATVSYDAKHATATDLMAAWIWHNGDASAGIYNNMAVKLKIEAGSAKTAYSPAARVMDADGTYPTLPVLSREGYDFGGWYTDAACTTMVTDTSKFAGEMLYAKWTLKSYKVMFDNLIEFTDWNTSSAGNGVISDVRDGGFTLTSNSGVGEATSESPYFPVTPGEKYKIDIEFEGDAWDVYIFFCDANGNWIDFADGPTNRYSSNGGTGIPADNAVFTAPNKPEVVKAKIRVDANGSSNTVSFRNIRVTKEGTSVGIAPYTPSQTVTYTEAYGTLPTPVKAGYNFLGWYDTNGNKIDATSIHNITSDIILYSKWSAQQYELTWVDGFGKTIKTETIDCGAAIVPPTENPTITAYTFAGWESYPAKMPAGNLTIKATWTPVNYTITYNANGGTLTGAASQSYNIKTPVTVASAPTRTGYVFAGWEVSGEGHNWNSSYDAGAALEGRYGNVTLTAKWTTVDYTITYELDGGALAGNPPRGYKITDTITLPTNPSKTGYNFNGWTILPGDHNWDTAYDTENNKVSNAYGNVTLVAKWTPKTYKVTWVDYDGTVLETDDAVEYNTMPEFNGAQPTREATVQYTYEFKGWTPEISVVTGNATYTAEYTPIEKTFTVKFHYTTADGEKTATIENVPYNASVTSLIPDEYRMGYLASADGFTHSHYVPSMNLGTVQNVTSDIEFTATYTLVSNVVLSEKGEGHLEPDCENPGVDSRICSICQYAHKEKTDALGHNYDSVITLLEPTCLADGTVRYDCSRCDNYYEEPVGKLGHKFTHRAEKQAFCNAQGWREHLYCENCERCYEVGASGEAPYETAIDPYYESPEHTPDEENPATCYNPQYCLKCGEIVVAQLKHDLYSEYVFEADSDISCTVADDYKIVTKCHHDCGYNVTEEKYGTLPHEHEFIETVAPTCTADGYDLYRCKNCTDEIQKNIVGKLNHTEGEWVVATESTCTVPGVENLLCGRCEAVIATRRLELAEHNPEENVTEPDCTNQGLREYICTECKQTIRTEIISSLGHKSSGLATCDDPSTCTVCKEVLQPALGHSWDNGVVTKEPTETETGMREYTCYRDEEHKKYEEIPVRVVIELPGIPEDGTIDFDADESGYIGNIADIVKVEEGIPYTTIVDKNGIVSINANGDIVAVADGTVVITVITNDGKYKKDFTATVRTLKKITFDVNGSLTQITAYAGDSFTAVQVNDYTDANGFLKTFTGWTMNGASVTEFICTGDMYLIAQFTASCDYTELDALTEKFYDVISGSYDNAGLLEANSTTIEAMHQLIAQFAADRSTRTTEEQYLIDAAAKKLADVIVRLYPVAGSEIAIRGETACTAGTYVEITAYLMPVDVEIEDIIWTTSDRRVGFYSDGKFFAVRPGTVTLKATRGTQTAEITIEVKGTVGARVVFFDTQNFNVQYILEGAYIVTETTNLFWSPYNDINFRVVTNHEYSEYSVLVNDVKVTPSADGEYTIPANTGDAHIRIVGLTEEDIENGNDGSSSSSKLSFWDLIRNFFKKIGDFFRNLFGG